MFPSLGHLLDLFFNLDLNIIALDNFFVINVDRVPLIVFCFKGACSKIYPENYHNLSIRLPTSQNNLKDQV